MDRISNTFSLLELDVEDDRIETTSSANNSEKVNGISDSTVTFFNWGFTNFSNKNPKATKGTKRASPAVNSPLIGDKPVDAPQLEFKGISRDPTWLRMSLPEPLPHLRVQSDAIRDPTCPLADVEVIATKITNTVPGYTGPELRSRTRKQSKEEINKMAQNVSSRIGFLLDPAHLEDLFTIASNDSPLSEHSIWMYFRGCSRTFQISSANAFSSAIKGIENILSKNQQIMSSDAENFKLVSDKLSVVHKHIESIPAVIGSLIKQEHVVTREAIQPKVLGSTITPMVVDLPPIPGAETRFPGKEEMKEILGIVGCPAHQVENVSTKLCGKISWSTYNDIISGNIVPEAAKKIVMRFKGK